MSQPAKTISVIFGTRPEAIKMAPVVLGLRSDARFVCDVCVTAQHREMLDQVLEVFEIVPETDLDLMAPNQTLDGLTARAVEAIGRYLGERKPDLVLVQGDTTTTFCAALAAFYHHIPVGHVEAGLRTGEPAVAVARGGEPDPDDAPGVAALRPDRDESRPTCSREGVQESRIVVTGNTVIDALFLAIRKVEASPPAVPGLPVELVGPGGQPLVLVTGHRRENFGAGFEPICTAIARLARRFPGTAFVYPVHLNPNVRSRSTRSCGGGLAERPPDRAADVPARSSR